MGNTRVLTRRGFSLEGSKRKKFKGAFCQPNNNLLFWTRVKITNISVPEVTHCLKANKGGVDYVSHTPIQNHCTYSKGQREKRL